MKRRTLLQALALGAIAGIAGCIAGGSDTEACRELSVEPNYKGWFDGVDNYHGTCDARGRDRVSVRVGTKANEAYWGYDPAAVAITPGTTVRWEWTGKGGAHDVVSEMGTFASGKPTDDAGTTFEHTFDEPGVYRYYCTPHRSMDMKGAVFVALD